MVAVSEGGRKHAQSPASALPSSHESPLNISLSSHYDDGDGFVSTGAGNGIWLNDQQKEYTFR